MLPSLSLSDLHLTYYPSDKWCLLIMFERFRPAINRIYICTLGFDIFSLTSSPFLIQLILRDFHDLP